MSLKSRIYSFIIRFYSIEKQARIAGVNMGSNNFVNSKFWSSEPYLITIGSNCAITSGVKIFTHGGARVARNRFPHFDCFGKVNIGDNVYIGTNALIMPGVNIDDNVLVAAGSIVCSSIPSGVVVAGNPARIIGTIDEYIERNLPYNLDTKGLSRREKEKKLKMTEEKKFLSKRYLALNK